MTVFARMDEIVLTLESLDVLKSERDVCLKLIKVLPEADYGIERCTLLSNDNISKAELERVVLRRHERIPVKQPAAGEALFAGNSSRGDGGDRGGHGGGGHRGGLHESSHNRGGGHSEAERGGGAVGGTTASSANNGSLPDRCRGGSVSAATSSGTGSSTARFA